MRIIIKINDIKNDYKKMANLRILIEKVSQKL
jgi:hypothetical protein